MKNEIKQILSLRVFVNVLCFQCWWLKMYIQSCGLWMTRHTLCEGALAIAHKFVEPIVEVDCQPHHAR